MTSTPGSIFAGYRPKATRLPPGLRLPAHLTQVASLSGCINEDPPDWRKRWDFNPAFCWNTESEAWAAVPEPDRARFTLFAYRALLCIFDDSGTPRPTPPEEFFAGPGTLPDGDAPAHFRSIGYDIVEHRPELPMLGYGCSPLSCNGMAHDITVNEYCLIPDRDAAIVAAIRFGLEKPEPGPFAILEVLTSSY